MGSSGFRLTAYALLLLWRTLHQPLGRGKLKDHAFRMVFTCFYMFLHVFTAPRPLIPLLSGVLAASLPHRALSVPFSPLLQKP